MFVSCGWARVHCCGFVIRPFQKCWVSGNIERYPSKKWKYRVDRLEAMSLVLAVAEAGSLSAAARQQRAPLATVSRKVSELEAHLQTKLFNRSSRALIPTDAGRSYIAAAKRILADVAEAERAASGEYTTPRGDLNVSAPFALGLLYLQPVVMEFLAAFPQVDVHLAFQDRAVNLPEEHVDVGVNIGALVDSSLIAVRIGEITRVVCASPAYLKSRGTPKSPDDLSRHDCISWDADPVANPMEVQARPNRICRAGAIAADREQSWIGVRCRARWHRDHRGVVLSRRQFDQIRRARSAAAGFSAAADAGELCLLAKPFHAGQTPRLPGFRAAAPEITPRRSAEKYCAAGRLPQLV